jgi:hypothetical protein
MNSQPAGQRSAAELNVLDVAALGVHGQGDDAAGPVEATLPAAVVGVAEGGGAAGAEVAHVRLVDVVPGGVVEQGHLGAGLVRDAGVVPRVEADEAAPAGADRRRVGHVVGVILTVGVADHAVDALDALV